MENEIILTAKTVEEAMAEARAKYADDDHELSFTILEMPKKGFLGIGSAPAKVKVTITKSLPDADLSGLVADLRKMKTGDEGGHKHEQKSQKQNQHPQNRNQKPQNQQNQAKPQGKNEGKKEDDSIPAALRTPVKKNDAQKKQNPPKKQNQRPADNRPAEEKKKDLLSAVKGIKDAPAAPTAKENFVVRAKDTVKKIEDKFDDIGDAIEDKFDQVEDKIEEKIDAVRAKREEKKIREERPKVEFVTPNEMQFAIDFANTLMENMKIPAKAVHNPDAMGETIPEGMVAARIEIEGDDSGILIGHHGETLDAIQYLVNLCASRKSESAKREFVKIVVDIEGYREKREETLRALARRMAAKAVKNRRNVVLEPMNPYERRIIHSEVQDIENVSTHSVGSDENRKIVITYEGADKVTKSKSRRRRRGGNKGERAEKPAKKEVALSAESAENIENYKRTAGEYPRQKPVRAKSIDEIRLDLSEDSTVTLGSIGVSDKADEEESLREY